MALLISLLAVAFSYLQWQEAKMQRETQFASALVFDLETELPRRAGIGVRNVGPGVARLNSVTYYLDGRILDDPSDALEAVKLDPDKDEGVTLDRGDSMAAGEVDWLIRYPIKRKGDEDKARELLENRLQIAVDYCSANGSCARKCSRPGGCPNPAP